MKIQRKALPDKGPNRRQNTRTQKEKKNGPLDQRLYFKISVQRKNIQEIWSTQKPISTKYRHLRKRIQNQYHRQDLLQNYKI